MVRYLIAALVLVTATAHADTAKLDAARTAVENVAYDEAAELLSAALEEGGHTPAQLAEIYRLSATTATVLGEHEKARAAYRAWVALDPKAALPTDAAVKFQDPFVAAQAFIKPKGGLDIRIVKTDDGELAIVVKSDPLDMAVSFSLGEGGALTPFAGKRRIVVKVPPGKAIVRVFVFDTYGNQLVARSFATFSEVPPEVTSSGTPLYRRWLLYAVPAVAAGGVGFYFRGQAAKAQDELELIAGTAGEHFFGEIRELEDRRDRNHRISTGMFIGGGVLAATAVVMFVIRPRDTTVVVPTAETGPGIALLGTF